jgi:hypothetical protein
MVTITLQLDDESARQLLERAAIAGLAAEELAAKEVSLNGRKFSTNEGAETIQEVLEREAKKADGRGPFAFFGIGNSDELRGADLKRQLADEGFGKK